jgi:hypothetical protein
MSRRHRRSGAAGSTAEAPVPRRQVAPGKRTLTQRLPGPAPERGAGPERETPRSGDPVSPPHRMVGAGYGSPIPPVADLQAVEADPVQERAAAGVASGSGGPLAHKDQIQASFGRHDIGHVEAHVGGEAADAAADIGARAYATGNQVAFATQPDLHTAAHEAAHVVQQRGGVQLKDGVGRAGDAYEQHADAVADRVVAGQSAEGLLDQMAGGSARREPEGSGTSRARQQRAVQKRPGHGKDTGKAENESGGSPATAAKEDQAIATLQAAADIVQNKERRLIAAAPASARAALELLYKAAVGSSSQGSAQPRGQAQPSERLAWLDQSLHGLEAAMRIVYATGPENQEWFRSQLSSHVEKLRNEIRVDAARDRVDQATLLPGQSKVVEVPKGGLTDETAAEYGQALLPSIDKLIATYATLNEQVVRLGHHRFEHIFDEMKEGWDSGMLRMERNRFKDVGSIVTAQSALFLLKGILSAPHAWEHAKHAETVIGKIESYTHLVGVAIETVGGLATLSMAIGACVLKLDGQLQLATGLMGAAGHATLKLANVIAAVEFVHGIMQMANPKSSAEEKIEGAVQFGTSLSWLGGVVLEKAFDVTGATAVGGAVSTAIVAAYLYWQVLMASHVYVSSTIAVAGLRPRFEYMVEHSARIRGGADHLIKAGLLLEKESDPAERQALCAVVREATRDLNSTVDYFLDACLRGKQVSPNEPGENPHLRAAFAPLQALRGPVDEPQAALQKAHTVLGRIGQVLDDAGNYVRLSMGLDRVEHSANDEDE